MFEEFLLENMHGVLIFIEVLWVGGFLAIFVIYFLVRRHFKKKRRAEEAEAQARRFPPPPPG